MNITESVLYLVPDAQFGFKIGHYNEYNYIAWSPINTLPQPTLAELEAIQVEVENKIALRVIQENKRREFPSIDELTVALWEKIVEGRSGDDSGINKLQNARLAVKAKYPKKDGT